MFVAGSPPDAAVIMVGANDVTAVNGIGPLPVGSGGCASASLQWSGRRRGHVSGLRVDQRHPSTTAVGGTRTRAPTRQGSGRRGSRGRRVGGSDGGSARAQLPRGSRGDVFRRRVSPVGSRLRVGCESTSPGALPRPRRVDRSDSSRTAVGYSVGRQIQGRPTGPVTRLLRRRPPGCLRPWSCRRLGSQERRGSVPDARALMREPLGAVMPEAVIVSTARSPSDGP